MKDIPRCAICEINNLYSDVNVFSVMENVDIYRKNPIGKIRHRICELCIDNIETTYPEVKFHIWYEFYSKSNVIDKNKTVTKKRERMVENKKRRILSVEV